ncbi:hypothetical protein ABZ502_29985 [Streptomyces abikoensis]|uniref:effector-associated constant component EACC1 n=1 Tax=Streptomyces abikoensis TaxID=97398 RepID=UPI0033C85B95
MLTLPQFPIKGSIAGVKGIGPRADCLFSSHYEAGEGRVRVRVRLLVDGDSAEEELRSLYVWLLADSQARRCADVAWGADVQTPANAMGGLLDVISLALGSGFSAASLAVSIIQWRSTRGGEGPSVTVELADGTKVTISEASLAEAERLLRFLDSPPQGRSEP